MSDTLVPDRALSRRDELVATMLDIVTEHGLDTLSVRRVATAAGVSIGTVQHHFATKDDMLVAAFESVVSRIVSRINDVALGRGVRENLALVLRELLPLDDERRGEVRVRLAFAARAAVAPELAVLQHDILTDITDELTAAFSALGQDAAGARTSARLALAATSGLAQHAVSAGASSELGPGPLTAALDRMLDRLTTPTT